MIDRKTTLVVAVGFAGVIVALYVSISTIFIVLLLGLLFVPPVLALASTLIEGASIISKELMQESEKAAMIIST